jgi:superfamily I DNA/RNA helicase
VSDQQRFKVFGAPGTGKTRYLTDVIVNKINVEGYDPSEIGCFTFSNSAANHLREQASKATFKPPSSFNISTIHSQCNKLIKDQLPDKYKLLTPDNLREINRFAKKHRFPTPGKLEFFGHGQDWIPDPVDRPNYWKAYSAFWTIHPFASLEEVYNQLPLPSTASPSEFGRFCHEWPRWKSEKNLIEFHDMPRLVLDEQLKPDQFLIQLYDEHQDVNPILDRVARLWMEEAEEIHVAGDPYQAIYSYNGSSPELFQQFDGYPVMLDFSRRLPYKIWTLGQSLLKWVPNYYPDDKPITAVTAEDRACHVQRLPLSALVPLGTELAKTRESVLILARTNAWAKQLAYELGQKGIVFTMLRDKEYVWTDRVMHMVNIYHRLKEDLPLSNERLYPKEPTQVGAFVKMYAKEWFLPEALKEVRRHPDEVPADAESPKDGHLGQDPAGAGRGTSQERERLLA